jgi:hypothetical protein
VIIFSVGQKAGLAFVPDDAGINITPSREIEAALEEGIQMYVGLNFLRILDDGDGSVAGLRSHHPG